MSEESVYPKDTRVLYRYTRIPTPGTVIDTDPAKLRVLVLWDDEQYPNWMDVGDVVPWDEL